MWSRTDWGLVVAGLGLSLVGALLVWSATRHTSGSAVVLRHLVTTVVGMVLFVLVTKVDLRTLRAWVPWVYLASLLGLVAVLSPLGSTINGSRSWIEVPGGFSIQPSELAKVAIVMGLAMLLAERRDRDLSPDRRDLLLAGLLVLLPIGLIMLQPDLGSAIVVLAMAFAVVAVAGAPKRLLALVVALGAAGVVAMFTTPVLSGYQRDRLTAFLDPGADPQGIGYQTRQVRLAIGSGGLHGEGLFHGRQTQGGVIPFQQTDFVFSVAGEELGFLGAAGVIALLAFLVLRTLVVGARSDAFGRLVAVGVAGWFTVQAVENVGMNLGITPVTGLPLPFVSYGGSSMFSCWLALGLVNAVHLGQGRRD
ncbi:rod shape-determining protein RodA [Lapillicoccus sp.]|uniref:rod shape-determining protein RodA n=1 Tax=Lapillicoccus sp. TaxID=1909287 RepID=UPI0025FE06D5|nr:rod shape-determining protein RodA [Lapillicoccus sp.]